MLESSNNSFLINTLSGALSITFVIKLFVLDFTFVLQIKFENLFTNDKFCKLQHFKILVYVINI